MKAYTKLWASIARLVFVILLFGMLRSHSVRAAGPWYVATTGNDSNTCLSPAAPCATINGAIGKAASGDTIYVGPELTRLD